MTLRIVLAIVALALAAVAFRHPAAPPAFETRAAPSPFTPHAPTNRGRRHRPAVASSLVYVAGAVRRPGLYRLQAGARAADAVAAAGGLAGNADAEAIDLAARVEDGDEIDAPRAGAQIRRRSTPRASRSHRRAPAPAGNVDVNAASSSELASVPGIGRAIAGRIVQMRDQAGPFGSLDELLDVAGMTQARLDRARPYLHELSASNSGG